MSGAVASVSGMQLLGSGALVLSPSDLTRAAACEFAVAIDLDARLGRIQRPAVQSDEMLERIAALGTAHEQQVLTAYRRQFGDWDGTSGGVAVADAAHYGSLGSLHAAAGRTQELLEAGADVIYQACFFDGTFLGYADFLVRTGDAWMVQDAKLARRAKVPALLQLGAYADQLARAGFTGHHEAALILGTGQYSMHRTDELIAVYRARMARLRQMLEDRLAASAALAWGGAGVRACLRCEICTPYLEQSGDVLLVAGASVPHRDRLAAAGVHTVADLAAATGPVDGVGASALARLRGQAQLQLRQDRAAASGDSSVLTEVVDPAPILALPPPSAGDIFFDFEGDPLWYDLTGADREDAWGLEYLFGIVEAPVADADPVFRPFWAHDRAQEKAALEQFLDYLTRRRHAHPDLHVYHYAPYEKSALLRLAGRHGVGEDVIDNLLRDGVLVDLYAVVRAGLRVGQRSYSLKKLEPLFRGARDEQVTTAADSIMAYAQACQARDGGNLREWHEGLRAIADYNQVDCLSTLQLRDWLLARVAQEPHAADPAATHVVSEEASESRQLNPLAGPLLAHAGELPRDPDLQAVAMLAAALDYHWRESKPFWWAHFDRLATDPSEWLDRRSTIVADEVGVLDDWHVPPRARSQKRRLRVVGRLEPGSDLREGEAAVAIYDPVLPPDAKTSAGGRRGWRTGVTIEQVTTAGADERDVLIVLEGSVARDAVGHDQLPMALGPTAGPQTTYLEERIGALATSVLEVLPGPLPSGPALDLLRRVPPRTQDGRPLPPPGSDRPLDDTIADAVAHLADSYLAVQGPPGTGKTYSGARVVRRLIERGWKVGVVAQSHAVVENFLDSAAHAEVPTDAIAKKARTGGKQSDLPWAAPSPTWYGGQQGGFLVGGTAWAFADPRNLPPGGLDLMVVDEAGQFALANTLAVASAAPRLLLLGDPQQLPQVSQGTHPEPVHFSALGWLTEGHDTLPVELGYFLEQTWRMHPQLCAAVSQMSYEGRLTAHPSTLGRSLVGVAPGVTGVPVEHTGRSVVSPEEVAEVVRQLDGLVGRTWHDGAVSRPLTAADVLIVAPYNAQVWAIRHALDASPHRAARVGTVDKFQGQQAPVVLVSLAASSAHEAPRGIEFLLNRNRLNVAVSRAQWCARLIHSPQLANHLPERPEQLASLGAFLQLTAWRSSSPSASASI